MRFTCVVYKKKWIYIVTRLGEMAEPVVVFFEVLVVFWVCSLWSEKYSRSILETASCDGSLTSG